MGIVKSFLPRTTYEKEVHEAMGDVLKKVSTFHEEGFKGSEEPTETAVNPKNSLLFNINDQIIETLRENYLINLHFNRFEG